MLEFGSGLTSSSGLTTKKTCNLTICFFVSLQGAEQWIVVNFEKKVRVKKIEIKFQGGFCAAQMRLEILNAEKKFHHLSDFYPQDSNSSQVLNKSNNLRYLFVYKLNIFKKFSSASK